MTTYADLTRLSEAARRLYEERCRAVARLSQPGQTVAFTRFETQWSIRWWGDGIEVQSRPYMTDIPFELLGRFDTPEQAMRAAYAEDAR